MTEDMVYLLAALAFFPVSYGLLRLLALATLWLCGDLLAAPERAGTPDSAPTREEWRPEPGHHALRGTGERARSYRSSL